MYGLYSSFYPVFIYFLFGTSRHISVGEWSQALPCIPLVGQGEGRLNRAKEPGERWHGCRACRESGPRVASVLGP